MRASFSILGGCPEPNQPAATDASLGMPLLSGDQVVGCADLVASTSAIFPALNEDLFAACAVAEKSKVVINVFGSAANVLEWVHTSTGLPWWASIPLTTVSLRLLLLPLSLRQAKIVRTNYAIYKARVRVSHACGHGCGACMLGGVQLSATPMASQMLGVYNIECMHGRRWSECMVGGRGRCMLRCLFDHQTPCAQQLCLHYGSSAPKALHD